MNLVWERLGLLSWWPLVTTSYFSCSSLHHFIFILILSLTQSFFVSLSVSFHLWLRHFWSHLHRHPYQIIKMKLGILYTHSRHMRAPGMDKHCFITSLSSNGHLRWYAWDLMQTFSHCHSQGISWINLVFFWLWDINGKKQKIRS